MQPLWQPGYEPTGKGRVFLLREIRRRIAEAAPLGDGFFRPWASLRQYAERLYLTDEGLPVEAERARSWWPGLSPATRLDLAESILRTAARFEHHGVRLGPMRPETIFRDRGSYGMHDPMIADGLLPLQPDWSAFSRLNFLAPELLRGETPSAASDRFAVGVTLYWLFTERMPFGDEDEHYIPARTLGQTPVDPRFYLPPLPVWAAEATMALLDRDPAQRPRAEDLLPLFAARPAQGTETQRRWCLERDRMPVARRPVETRRPRLTRGVAVFLPIIVLILALLAWHHAGPKDPPSLREAEAVVTRFYAARNRGDDLLLSLLLAPGVRLPFPPPAPNCAVWDQVRRQSVRPGLRPGRATARVILEETSLIEGAVRRWQGADALDLAVQGGRWRITRITRVD